MRGTARNDLRAKIQEAILQRGLFSSGETLVLGVSGGLDSMVLLHAVVSLAQSHGWKMHIAHFDHQLRGKESAGDARFVARQAKKLGLGCTVGSGDVSAHAQATKVSVEMAARELRRKFLVKVAEEQGSKSVVL